MTRMLRAEFLKLTTSRLTYGLLATATGLSALLALLAASRAGVGNTARALPPLSTAAGLSAATTTTGLALLLAAVLGVTLTAGEFRHQTATATYLGFPHRTRVLAVKLAAAACAGAFFGLASGTAATSVGLAFASGKGDRLTLTAADLAGHIAGATIGAALLAATGAALGSLLRSQLGAVTGLLAWALIIETALGGFFTTLRPYLPFSAATTLGGTALGEAALGIVRTAPSGPAQLPFAASAALVAAVTLAVAALAACTTVPRDIT